ncbi:CK1/CK1/CK1-D protein kinase [Allomyces macrogynus ATCC 38327]|uniref:non-specific serine/threonine protein kinase n=1 Tax=Allomyces macrogynus (strain ATCC 38327) TaxID=578462 RepID=A0A0L0S1H7_ALLM3|nr:CK1/CK1/CK1-D protein kinase [Allomyces macrogynus ATCC 38327]|eukprot:KNE56246.1 CK1/CK1/CK1-D protein kinase [Allomyces macrogynus ATCC 38327]
MHAQTPPHHDRYDPHDAYFTVPRLPMTAAASGAAAASATASPAPNVPTTTAAAAGPAPYPLPPYPSSAAIAANAAAHLAARSPLLRNPLKARSAAAVLHHPHAVARPLPAPGAATAALPPPPPGNPGLAAAWMPHQYAAPSNGFGYNAPTVTATTTAAAAAATNPWAPPAATTYASTFARDPNAGGAIPPSHYPHVQQYNAHAPSFVTAGAAPAPVPDYAAAYAAAPYLHAPYPPATPHAPPPPPPPQLTYYYAPHLGAGGAGGRRISPARSPAQSLSTMCPISPMSPSTLGAARSPVVKAAARRTALAAAAGTRSPRIVPPSPIARGANVSPLAATARPTRDRCCARNGAAAAAAPAVPGSTHDSIPEGSLLGGTASGWPGENTSTTRNGTDGTRMSAEPLTSPMPAVGPGDFLASPATSATHTNARMSLMSTTSSHSGAARWPWYSIGTKLGAGSFGCVYRGHRLPDRMPVAIKVEPLPPPPTPAPAGGKAAAAAPATHQGLLPAEAQVLLALAGGAGFPRLHWYGVFEVVDAQGHRWAYRALVMDQLGASLQDLFERCHRRFSIPTVCMIADQLLCRLETLHARGYLHRDLKPENVLVGCAATAADGGSSAGVGAADLSHVLHLIDFGLACPIPAQPGEVRNGVVASGRAEKCIGTLRYMSRCSHRGRPQAPKDDLESLGYLLVYFAVGHLPWQKKYLKVPATPAPTPDNPNPAPPDHKRLVLRAKEQAVPKILCQTLPRAFEEYMARVRAMDPKETPDYTGLRDLFVGAVRDLGMRAYDWRFDWDPVATAGDASASGVAAGTLDATAPMQALLPPTNVPAPPGFTAPPTPYAARGYPDAGAPLPLPVPAPQPLPPPPPALPGGAWLGYDRIGLDPVSAAAAAAAAAAYGAADVYGRGSAALYPGTDAYYYPSAAAPPPPPPPLYAPLGTAGAPPDGIAAMQQVALQAMHHHQHYRQQQQQYPPPPPPQLPLPPPPPPPQAHLYEFYPDVLARADQYGGAGYDAYRAPAAQPPAEFTDERAAAAAAYAAYDTRAQPPRGPTAVPPPPPPPGAVWNAWRTPNLARPTPPPPGYNAWAPPPPLQVQQQAQAPPPPPSAGLDRAASDGTLLRAMAAAALGHEYAAWGAPPPPAQAQEYGAAPAQAEYAAAAAVPPPPPPPPGYAARPHDSNSGYATAAPRAAHHAYHGASPDVQVLRSV